MAKKKAKKTSSRKKSISPLPAALKNQPEKSVLLDLAVKRSDGVEDVYLLDAVEVGGLLVGPENFIEVPTRLTPGVRFITLRYHDGQ